jgi:hypothetical protein
LRTESGSEKVKLASIKIKRGEVPADASDFDFCPSHIHINIPHHSIKLFSSTPQ